MDPKRLYLMAPIQVYGTDEMRLAASVLWSRLTGCETEVISADGLYRNSQDWLRRWPKERSSYVFGAIVCDDGWIGKGVHRECCDLVYARVPVWYWDHGRPTRKFSIGSTRPGDWQRYAQIWAFEHEASQEDGLWCCLAHARETES